VANREVLLTDAEERSVLAACRGLNAAGYTVSAVARTSFAASHWSRYCAHRYVLPDPRDDQTAFVDGLFELLRDREFAILLPGAEPSIIAVSEQRTRLEHLVRLGLPAQQVVERSLDKIHFVDAAAAAGLACPPSVVCADKADARAAVRTLGFPVVLKPARSFVRNGPSLRQQPVIVARDEMALEAALLSFGDRFLVQRFDGNRPLVSCSGVVVDGRVRAQATARYLRTWPAHAGSASLAVTVPLALPVQARIEHLLAELGWQGVFEIELLEQDAGRFSAIDLNPRFYGWLTLAIRSGANLPAVWCDSLLGRPSRSTFARTGMEYRWEEGELLNAVSQLRHGRLAAAARVLRPRRRVVHAYLEFADPLPLVARLFDVMFSRFRRRRRKSVAVRSASPSAAQRRSHMRRRSRS
jgi:predicted ATP-grasp superfamily ATP-dependent carboligase